MAPDPYPEIIYTGKGLDGFSPFTDAVKKYETELQKPEGERTIDKFPGTFRNVQRNFLLFRLKV